MHTIEQTTSNRKNYLELLLLGDEQESMIDRYLERSDMFVLQINSEAMGVCVVCNNGDGVLEIKNIAIHPSTQQKGYGKALIDFVKKKYSTQFTKIIVGTGETPSTLNFYKKCGFKYSHRIENFFTDNYNHAIVEEGVVLRDMIYFEAELINS